MDATSIPLFYQSILPPKSRPIHELCLSSELMTMARSVHEKQDRLGNGNGRISKILAQQHMPHGVPVGFGWRPHAHWSGLSFRLTGYNVFTAGASVLLITSPAGIRRGALVTISPSGIFFIQKRMISMLSSTPGRAPRSGRRHRHGCL